jgi:hypothetical protein
MWLYVQTWLPLLTIGLTAAICFSVSAFIMAQPQRAVGSHVRRSSESIRKRLDVP